MATGTTSKFMQLEKHCKYCKKKVINSENCIVCQAAFHPSCAAQSKLQNVSGEIVCCRQREKSEVKTPKTCEMFFGEEDAMKNTLKIVLKEFFDPIKRDWEGEMHELKASVESLKNGLERQNKISEEIINRLKTLSEENRELRKRVEKLESEMDPETIINEMLERQNRASNVILFNVNEVNEANSRARIESEKKALKEIINNVENFGDEEFKFQRLGKFSQQKTRPVKILFENKVVAIKFLKEKQKIIQKIPSIRIYADQTKKQREYFIQIKGKLEELKQAGHTNKTIRYINNIPTIVEQTRNFQ